MDGWMNWPVDNELIDDGWMTEQKMSEWIDKKGYKYIIKS